MILCAKWPWMNEKVTVAVRLPRVGWGVLKGVLIPPFFSRPMVNSILLLYVFVSCGPPFLIFLDLPLLSAFSQTYPLLMSATTNTWQILTSYQHWKCAFVCDLLSRGLHIRREWERDARGERERERSDVEEAVRHTHIEEGWEPLLSRLPINQRSCSFLRSQYIIYATDLLCYSSMLLLST